jgi:hypothetical protein
MMTLTDIQLILLTTAASRPNGSLLPPPESLGASAARIRKAVATLIKQGFAEEIATTGDIDAWREEEEQGIAVIITGAGRAAIAPDGDSGAEVIDNAASEGEATAARSVLPTKTALVLDLLGREAGATLDDLVAATGWLPHTTRAALTGLRKKGHALVGTKEGRTTRYHIAVKASA